MSVIIGSLVSLFSCTWKLGKSDSTPRKYRLPYQWPCKKIGFPKPLYENFFRATCCRNTTINCICSEKIVWPNSLVYMASCFPFVFDENRLAVGLTNFERLPMVRPFCISNSFRREDEAVFLKTVVSIFGKLHAATGVGKSGR